MIIFKHKYEIYIPDRYINKDKKVVKYEDSKVLDIIRYLMDNLDLSGVSVRQEEGYYNSSIGLNRMINSIVYFYTNRDDIDFGYIKSILKEQESILVTKDNIGYLV